MIPNGRETLALERKQIGVAPPSENETFVSDGRHPRRQRPASAPRSRHVIAATATNSASLYVSIIRTMSLVTATIGDHNLRPKWLPSGVADLRAHARTAPPRRNFFGFAPLNPKGLEFTAMRNTITRTTIAGLAALSLMGSLLATAEPAAAGGVHVGGGGHGGGFHGGGGGFHGGGFHGGGFHGGGWHGGGWQAVAGTAVAGMAADGAARPWSAD